MFVRLLTTSAQLADMEHNAAYAMLTCHANTHKLQNEKPEVFIKRAIKAQHGTVIEHIWLTYEVKNLSRVCLHELERHRHITLSVESTRYTLKRILESNIDDGGAVNEAFLEQFDATQQNFLHEIFSLYETNPDMSNDELKYYIPEFWPTNLIMTANVRELRHIISLRTSSAALKEFQDLARKFIDVVPERFRYLFNDCVSF